MGDDARGRYWQETWQIVLLYRSGVRLTVDVCVEVDLDEEPGRRFHAWPSVPGYASLNRYGPTAQDAIFDACSGLATDDREPEGPSSLSEIIPPGPVSMARVAQAASPRS